MEKEFNALRKLAGFTPKGNHYLDPESSINFLEYIENKLGKVMIQRVHDYFNTAYKPKFDFEVDAELIEDSRNPFHNWNYPFPQVMIHFSKNEETFSYVVAMNTTKRAYVCGTMSQSSRLEILIKKIEKDVYAEAKAAAKKKKKVNVDELIRFHS